MGSCKYIYTCVYETFACIRTVRFLRKTINANDKGGLSVVGEVNSRLFPFSQSTGLARYINHACHENENKRMIGNEVT